MASLTFVNLTLDDCDDELWYSRGLDRSDILAGGSLVLIAAIFLPMTLLVIAVLLRQARVSLPSSFNRRFSVALQTIADTVSSQLSYILSYPWLFASLTIRYIFLQKPYIFNSVVVNHFCLSS